MEALRLASSRRGARFGRANAAAGLADAFPQQLIHGSGGGSGRFRHGDVVFLISVRKGRSCRRGSGEGKVSSGTVGGHHRPRQQHCAQTDAPGSTACPSCAWSAYDFHPAHGRPLSADLRTSHISGSGSPPVRVRRVISAPQRPCRHPARVVSPATPRCPITRLRRHARPRRALARSGVFDPKCFSALARSEHGGRHRAPNRSPRGVRCRSAWEGVS